MRTKLINPAVLNPLKENLGVFSQPSFNDIVKHGGIGVKEVSPVGYNSYLDKGRYSAGADDTCGISYRKKKMTLLNDFHISHIYIFLSYEEARDYVDGKYSIRFYRPDISYKGHRVKFPDEFAGREDYNSKCFECRDKIVGFRTLSDALMFRRLCMNKRCYKELCTNVCNSFKNTPEFNNCPIFLDEIMVRRASHILAVPIPLVNSVYTDIIWFNPTLPLLAFKLDGTKVKYIEVPILPDKTYIPITEPWVDEADKKKGTVSTGTTVDILVDYSSPSGDLDALQQDVPNVAGEKSALSENQYTGTVDDTLVEDIKLDEILTEDVNIKMLYEK